MGHRKDFGTFTVQTGGEVPRNPVDDERIAALHAQEKRDALAAARGEPGFEHAPVVMGIPYMCWPLSVLGDYDFGRSDGLLSHELAQDLRVWNSSYFRSFGEDGWRSEDARRAITSEAAVLRERVQTELGSEFNVVLDRLLNQ